MWIVLDLRLLRITSRLVDTLAASLLLVLLTSASAQTLDFQGTVSSDHSNSVTFPFSTT
jgi:hypothetical protein